MAEEPIISTFVGNIFRRLSSAAVKDIGSMWGVNEELVELEEAILSIKSLVVHAEEKLQVVHDNDKNEVRRWLKKLEDAVFEADDLMDEFSSYEAQRMRIMADRKEVTKKVCTAFYSTSNKLLLAGFRRQKIKTMHDRLVSIRDDRKFHLEENYTINVTPSLEDREKMAIIECLLDVKINEENNVSVFPIFYSRWDREFDRRDLARAVFDDEKVINHFDLRMWLHTRSYDEFDKTGPIREMLKYAADKDFDENIEMDQLHKELYETIKGKRYLLVLDNISTYVTESEIWESLVYLLLLDCANGSKIIVTGFSLDAVIDFVSAVEPYIRTRLLGPEESWDLFKNVVFKNNDQEEAMNINNSKIVEIGKSIVERCGGNPYSIRTIGRMLLDYSANNNNPAEKETEYWFSSFLEDFSKIPREDIYKLLVLKLGCYDILPLPLKRCFVYCYRLFPKGFEIDVKTLINLWVAQGFIDSDSSSEKSMEDVGYEYVQYLRSRHFFIDYKYGELFMENFIMSNIMHDLAILVSSGGTMTMLATLNNEFDDDEHRIDRRSTRYASLHLDHQDSSSKIPNSVVFQAKSIRALIVLPNQSSRKTEEGLSQSICDKIMLNCKLLRVLDLHSLRMEVVPNSIGKLKHLTYLDISGNTDIKALPNSITMLHCLITLKLSSCYGLQELPRDIKKLISLKHLEIDGCYRLTRMPRGLGQLTQLETLSEFVLLSKGNIGNSCSLKELATLNSLRGKLKIKNLGIMEDSEQSNQILERKEHLRSLTLSWDLTRSTPSVIDDITINAAEKQLECLKPHTNIKELALVGYGGIKFCNWLSSLKNLAKFSLRKCKCQHLPPLLHLPFLEVLILEEMPNLKYIISNDVEYDTSGRDYFQRLKEVRLTELPNLKRWWQEEHPTSSTISSSLPASLRSLSKLVIKDCPKLRSMPLFLNVKDYLLLDNTSFDTFQQIINAQSDDNLFTPLKYLRSLCIIGIKELDNAQCNNIKWEHLQFLNSLRFDHLPKLFKLPDGLQSLTTLEVLHIRHCNIKTLPDWIGKFKNLKNLRISECHYLNSLQPLQSLKRLDTLEIVDCPILSQRCQRGTGADWDNIIHIPIVKFYQPQSWDNNLRSLINYLISSTIGRD